MKVNEIFLSIQGESTWQGMPFVFVRLSGCNLRCSYCDTTYAYDDGEELTVEQVETRIRQFDCTRVEFTGGEPLLQEECFELASKMARDGYDVLVETNGTLDVSRLDRRVVKIIDIKCPGSGFSHEVMWKNLEILGDRDEIKFVISSREDYEWACRAIKDRILTGKTTVLFSPNFDQLELRDLAAWILEDGLKVRLNVQIHKYIWKPQERGR